MIASLLDLALNNLLSPVILFFILGFGARCLKSDLDIPGNVSKFIAIYLMMAIGYKGGYSLSRHDLDALILVTLFGGMAFSFSLPFLAFFFLSKATKFKATEKAVIAAHYGSVSVVTFVTAVDFLNNVQIESDSWMVAVLAAMETPAIFACFLMINMWTKNKGNKVSFFDATVWKEIFLNGSVVLLLGGFFVGWIAGDRGMAAVEPFFVDIFKGVLCLFMIDIGMVAASKIGDKDSKLSFPLIGFGIIMPLIGAVLGSLFAVAIGLSVGNATLFAVLCASASYIAVPAAVRIALPKANLSPAVTLSLAVTFPFNIVFGLPLYLYLVQYMSGQ